MTEKQTEAVFSIVLDYLGKKMVLFRRPGPVFKGEVGENTICMHESMCVNECVYLCVYVSMSVCECV